MVHGNSAGQEEGGLIERSLRVRFLVLALAALAVGLVYLLPQLLAFRDGMSFAYFIKADEPSYAARLARVMEGFWNIGNPWTYEHRNAPNLIPALPEWTMALVAKILGLSADQMVYIGRSLFPAIGTAVMYFACRFLGFGYGVALVTSVWVFADPGVYYYKPAYALFSKLSEHPLNRFSNPVFGLLLFLLAWFAGARAFLSDRFSVRDSLIAGVLLGAQFYVSIYYWTHSALLFLLCAMFLDRSHRWRTLFVGAVTTLLVALPYFYKVFELQADPNYKWIAWRNGLFLKERGWYLLTHKGLWLWTVLLIPLAFRKSAVERFLLFSVISGLACYFSTLLTGVSLQNFHWHYTLAPLMSCAVIHVISVSTHNYVPKLVKSMGPLLIVVPLVSGVVAGVREYKQVRTAREPGLGGADANYAEALRWLKANATSNDVVVADARTLLSLPSRIGLRIWSDSVVQLVSFEEILRRNQLLWRLEGVDSSSLRQRLTPSGEPPVPACGPGLSSEILSDLERRGRPPFDMALQVELAQRISEGYKKLSDEELLQEVRSLRVNYLMRGNNEKHWTGNIDKFFRLEPVGVFGGVQIDRIKGWRGDE